MPGVPFENEAEETPKSDRTERTCWAVVALSEQRRDKKRQCKDFNLIVVEREVFDL